MSIGTPLAPSATKVMLLGSGELGKEVIIALQRFGVEVIAVDRYENAPGHQVAHRAYTIDMTDANALKTLVAKEKPHFIVPEIEALNTDALADIEREGLATVIPTVKAVQLTMNREGIRRLAAEELKLPVSPYAFARSADALQASIDGSSGNKPIGYPCFIKPTMSSSGKGQSRVTEKSQVQAAWDYAATGGRVNQGVVIVEGQIDFDYETYFCEPIGHVQKSGDYVESWQPQAMTAGALKGAQNIAKAITDSLGGLGLFGVELFVKGDQVWFSEVSPRPHDTGMVTMCTQRLSEFELHARAILGLPVDVSLLEAGASAVIYGGVESKNLHYEGLEAALKVPCSDVRLFGKPESFVKRRMGVALATGKDIDEARARAKLAACLVKPVSV
jgi:phosphoribosylglycinamide formyltransferase 2